LASLRNFGGQTENPKSTGNLKLRHEKFVEYYLANGGNATQAARDAGYSPNPGSLRTLGSWLLKKPEIQERIRIRILEGARVHTDEVLGVLASQMRANLMDVLDDNGQVDMAAVRELDLAHFGQEGHHLLIRPPRGSSAEKKGSTTHPQAIARGQQAPARLYLAGTARERISEHQPQRKVAVPYFDLWMRLLD
jgi:hypothetical protein